MNEVDNNITYVILDLVKTYVEELNNMPITHGPNIICRNAYDINDGFCDNFAEDLVKLLGGENDTQFILTNDMFLCDFYEEAVDLWGEEDLIKTINGAAWSKKMLSLYSTPPVKDIRLLEYLPQHSWVCINKKFYDAENPEGVNSPWELLIFKNYLKSLL